MEMATMGLSRLPSSNMMSEIHRVLIVASIESNQSDQRIFLMT